jgi:hypothetical protein
MSIRGRISKLEGKAISHDCLLCGYPRTGVYRIVIRPDTDPLPTCISCGHELDDDGAPLHTPYKRIVLDRPHLL